MLQLSSGILASLACHQNVQRYSLKLCEIMHKNAKKMQPFMQISKVAKYAQNSHYPQQIHLGCRTGTGDVEQGGLGGGGRGAGADVQVA